MISYSVVVPVYKSGPWLDQLCDRVAAAMARYGDAFELLLVNDASPDDCTWPAIERMASKYPWVRGLDLLYNVGQFKATLCGFESARGALVITMDDDLQQLPEEIPLLIDALERQPELDCVIGSYRQKQHQLYRNVGSTFAAWLNKVMYGKPSHIKTTSFRIMRRYLAQALMAYRTANPQLGPLLLNLTRKVQNIEISHQPRTRGKSGYPFFALVTHIVDNIVQGSIAPLRFFSLTGMLIAFVAAGLGTGYFIWWLLGWIKVPGFATLTILISLFSGFIIAGIGLVGEYIARIIKEITGPRTYWVRRSVGNTRE